MKEGRRYRIENGPPTGPDHLSHLSPESLEELISDWNAGVIPSTQKEGKALVGQLIGILARKLSMGRAA